MTAPAISCSEAAQLGWRRVDPKPWSKLDARWLHVLGWRLVHCGHPTALTPWALYSPAGEMICTGALREGQLDAEGLRITGRTHGTAWPSLRDAMGFVASQVDRAAKAARR